MPKLYNAKLGDNRIYAWCDYTCNYYTSEDVARILNAFHDEKYTARKIERTWEVGEFVWIYGSAFFHRVGKRRFVNGEACDV